MGFNWTEGCYRNSTLTESAFSVLLGIARYANSKTGECWPTRAGLAAVCRVSEDTVKRALKVIEASGEVHIERGNGRGHNTVYRMNPELLKGVTMHPLQPERGAESTPLVEEKGAPCTPFEQEKVSICTPLAADSLYINLSEEKEPVKDICPPTAEKEDDRFDEFWTLYPRKEGKKKARETWANLAKKDRAAALATLPDFLPAYASTEPQFIPHPTTWLNQRRWEDNPPPIKTTKLAPSKAVRNQFRDPAAPRRTNVIIDAQWRTP